IHRAALFSDESKYTVLSKSLTGRMGRMIRNRITEEIKYETEVLPFPLQTRLMSPLKAAAIAQGKTDMINFWSGQNAVGLKHTKATDLIQALVAETTQFFH
ncbi:MAG: nitronate monooxygenase, partial [Chitinophagaceae bacterium]